MAELISLDKSPEAAHLRAKEQLCAGGVVAIPTDTVYGLAARAADKTAVAKLSILKQRPASIPIAVLVANISQALDLAAQPPQAARLLMKNFWPGPLTIVLTVGSAQLETLGSLGGAVRDKPDAKTADAATIGVRCPNHAWVRELVGAVGPLATTSANLHGNAPYLTAGEIEAAFGDSQGLSGAGSGGADSAGVGSAALDLIIDGGTLNSPASTVVGWEGERLVVFREGSITEKQLREALLAPSPSEAIS